MVKEKESERERGSQRKIGTKERDRKGMNERRGE